MYSGCIQILESHEIEKVQIFQDWKVMDSGPGPGKSWKINEIVCHILTCVHVSGLYIHYDCLLTDLVRHRSTVVSSNTIKLQLLEIFW